MIRPLAIRLLLAFLLLFSQQAATVHALEHLGGLANPPALAQAGDEASELAKAVAQHQNCHQCLAFAQLAAPLAAAPRSFAPPPTAIHGAPAIGAAHRQRLAAFGYQPRAPPHA